MGSYNGKASVVTDENVSVTRLVTNKNVLKFSTDNVTIYATVTRKPE